MTDAPATKREIRWRIWQQLPLLVVLVLLWMMLWGSLTPLTIVTGILVAVLVTRAFYLPPVELSGRFNPLWFLVFLVQFLGELVYASFQVGFQALSPRGVTSNSVIAVQLITRSDFLLTLTAIALSLVPGSIVVEVDREKSILFLHALNTRTQDDIDKAHNRVLEVEGRLVRALGSKDDVRRMSK